MPHIHDAIDFCVEVFVVHDGKVLLRKHDKYGIWLSVGGHIELDEDPNEAAIREVKEEVGLDIELYNTRSVMHHNADSRDLIPPIVMNRHRINESHEHIALIYFARTHSDHVIPEKETDEWKWCTRADLETMELREEVKYNAHQALTLLA